MPRVSVESSTPPTPAARSLSAICRPASTSSSRWASVAVTCSSSPPACRVQSSGPDRPGPAFRAQPSRRLKASVSPRAPSIQMEAQAAAISSSPSSTVATTVPGIHPWSPLISRLFRP